MTDPRTFKSRSSERSLPEALEKRLATYALVAGAGLLAAPAVQAGVIYTPANVTMTLGSNNPYNLNIDNAGLAEFRFNITHGSWVSQWTYSSAWTYFWGALRVSPLGPGGAVLGGAAYKGYGNNAFALNGSINQIGPLVPSAQWRTGNVKMGSQTSWGSRYGYWNNYTDRYLGLRFQIGSNTHYGWARLDVSVTSQAYYTAHLTGYAYESVTGQSIHAGDEGGVIPEPGTLGLLAGGIVGLALWRRRKRVAE